MVAPEPLDWWPGASGLSWHAHPHNSPSEPTPEPLPAAIELVLRLLKLGLWASEAALAGTVSECLGSLTLFRQDGQHRTGVKADI